MIASFLPLPPKPKIGSEMMEVDDDVEMALESQLLYLQQRRHDNARWWRYLNRWMISLGVVIIVIIVSSRTWFLNIPSLTNYHVDHTGCHWHHNRLLMFSLSWNFSSALTSLSTTVISISYALRTRIILSPNPHAFIDTSLFPFRSKSGLFDPSPPSAFPIMLLETTFAPRRISVYFLLFIEHLGYDCTTRLYAPYIISPSALFYFILFFPMVTRNFPSFFYISYLFYIFFSSFSFTAFDYVLDKRCLNLHLFSIYLSFYSCTSLHTSLLLLY